MEKRETAQAVEDRETQTGAGAPEEGMSHGAGAQAKDEETFWDPQDDSCHVACRQTTASRPATVPTRVPDAARGTDSLPSTMRAIHTMPECSGRSRPSLKVPL